MNFSFNIGSKISMSNGSMEIKNGNQTIRMGPNGMEIKNGRSSNITMSGNGIQVINMGNDGMNLKISSTNGISINGNQMNDNFRGQTFNYNFTSKPYEGYPEYDSDCEEQDGENNYYEENTLEDEEEEEIEEGVEEEEEENEEIVDRGLTFGEIECLPTRRFKVEIKNKKSNKDSASCMCSICKCDYMNLEKLRTLPCFHSFHMECIDPWLAIKNLCPLCKNKVADRR